MTEPTDDPQNWRIDVEPSRLELYRELSESPRPLTTEEAAMMVELVDAWRALEHRKHIALSNAMTTDED